MRRALLIALVFLPAVVAAWFLRDWNRETGGAVRRRPEKPPAATSESPLFTEAVSGTEGRNTFFIKRARAGSDPRAGDPPRSYYHVRHWTRREAGDFDIEDLVVLVNPALPADGDASGLLVLANDVDTASVRDRLLDPPAGATLVQGARGRLSGGRSIEEFDVAALSGGFSARVGAGPGGANRVRIEGDTADAGFESGRLARLEMPGAFSAIGGLTRLEGRGLLAGTHDPVTTIAAGPLLVLGDADRPGVERLRLSSAGPMRHRPLDGSPVHGDDLLERLEFESGIVSLEKEVLVKLEDLEIRGDSLETRFHRDHSPRGGGRMVIDSGDVDAGEGHKVEIRLPGCLVIGSHARFNTHADGSSSVEVTGAPVKVDWNASGEPVANAAAELSAACQGRMTLRRPAAVDREAPTILEMRDLVTLALETGSRGRLDVSGDALDIRLEPVKTLLSESDATALRREFASATVTGSATGRSTTESFSGGHLEIRRERDDRGLLLGDRFTLAEDAHVELTLGNSAADRERPWIGDSKETLVYWRAASPFADSSFEGSGGVRFRRERPEGGLEEANAGHVRALLGPRGDSGRPILARLDADGEVRIEDGAGADAKGERLEWKRWEGNLLISGPGSSIHWPDAAGQPREVVANRIEVDRGTSRLIADGEVHGEITLPALVMGRQRRREATARERDLEDPRTDVPWKLDTEKLTLNFLGAVPISARRDGETGDRPALKDLTLEGVTRLENVDQTLSVEKFYWDQIAASGWAEGSPLVLEFVENADRLVARRIVTQPEWTLFEQDVDLLLHVHPRGASTASGLLEPLNVTTKGDVIFREGRATCTGQTHLARGPLAAPHTRVDCGHATIDFAADSVGAGRDSRSVPQSIEKIEARESVDFSMDSLSGQGDVALFDFAAQKLWLQAEKGRCRMKIGGSNMTAPRLVYDIQRRIIDVWKVEGGVAKEKRDR